MAQPAAVQRLGSSPKPTRHAIPLTHRTAGTLGSPHGSTALGPTGRAGACTAHGPVPAGGCWARGATGIPHAWLGRWGSYPSGQARQPGTVQPCGTRWDSAVLQGLAELIHLRKHWVLQPWRLDTLLPALTMADFIIPTSRSQLTQRQMTLTPLPEVTGKETFASKPMPHAEPAGVTMQSQGEPSTRR